MGILDLWQMVAPMVKTQLSPDMLEKVNQFEVLGVVAPYYDKIKGLVGELRKVHKPEEVQALVIKFKTDNPDMMKKLKHDTLDKIRKTIESKKTDEGDNQAADAILQVLDMLAKSDEDVEPISGSSVKSLSAPSTPKAGITLPRKLSIENLQNAATHILSPTYRA
jgi:hypothetical protein